MRGTVSAVEDEAFTLDVGPERVRVSVEHTASAPLEEAGQTISVGDVVRWLEVAAAIDRGFFGERELAAQAITIVDDATRIVREP